jgi:hypothetical protein
MNNPFDSLIDPIIERCRPHAVTMRDFLMMFATGTLERLDRLVDAVEGDATYSIRREYHGSSAAGPASVTIEVPANDVWILESVAARTSPATASNLDIREQGGRLRFAQDTTLRGSLTGVFTPMHLNGGTVLTVTLADPGEFHITFRAVARVPKRHSISGMQNGSPDRRDFRQELETMRRHQPAFVQHEVATQGPTHVEAQTGTHLHDASS